MMRFRGGGVGHKSTRQATDFFKKDRHTLDGQKTKSDTFEEMNDGVELENEKMEGLAESDGADDYGYELGENQSESEDEKSSEDESDSEMRDGDLGPEDDGCAVDSDMEELGYAEL
jgi:hypothetical protein